MVVMVVDKARGSAWFWAAARRQREVGSEEPAQAWPVPAAAHEELRATHNKRGGRAGRRTPP